MKDKRWRRLGAALLSLLFLAAGCGKRGADSSGTTSSGTTSSGGSNTAAADTMGINVYVIRYLCVLVSGIFAGFGGASMTLAIIPQFTPTAISGQGFIALAAVIFGKWTPHGAYGACLLFGAAQALTVTLGGGDFAVPSQILAMLPYMITIAILILFVGKSSAPKASGQPYEKGAR